MKAIVISTLVLLSILLSCTQPPDYPIEPQLTFNRFSRDFMLQGFGPEDSIIMFVDFTDGDGDLGSEDDSIDVFITDTRLNAAPLNYKLPFIPEQGAGNGISGEIGIVLPASCCIYPNNIQPPCTASDTYPFDTLIYEVFIKDRAGNESNRILSGDIYLDCTN